MTDSVLIMGTPEVTSVIKSRFSIDAILKNKRLSGESSQSPTSDVYSSSISTHDTHITDARHVTDTGRLQLDTGRHGVETTAVSVDHAVTSGHGSTRSPSTHQASPSSISIGICSRSGSSPLDLTNHSTELMASSRPDVTAKSTRCVPAQPHRDILTGLRDVSDYCSAYTRDAEHLFTASQRYDDADDVIDVETVRQQVAGTGFRPVAPGRRPVYSGEEDSDACSGEYINMPLYDIKLTPCCKTTPITGDLERLL